MGKTIRATINHSTRNHSVNRQRTQNRRRTDVVDGEFKRANRYNRHTLSWTPRPHGRAFDPKDVVKEHVVSARKRRDQKRLRKDYLNGVMDTLNEDVLAEQHVNDADFEAYYPRNAAQKKMPLSRSYVIACDERTLIERIERVGCNVHGWSRVQGGWGCNV
jgi:hypothetical protein